VYGTTLNANFHLEEIGTDLLTSNSIPFVTILTNSNQQTRSYKFTSHIAVFLSVVLITEMLEICIQTSYDQNVQLILFLSVCEGVY
jgi:hypothetical protein